MSDKKSEIHTNHFLAVNVMEKIHAIYSVELKTVGISND